MKGQSLTRAADAPEASVIVATLKNHTNSLFVNGLVNAQPRDMLLDTGATMTIIRPEILKGKTAILPTRWALRTATGESVNVLGETIADFRIGDTKFRYRVLIPNIEQDVILGMDIMAEFGFKLDLHGGILRVNGEDIVLNRSRDMATRVILASDIMIERRSQVNASATLNEKIGRAHV